MMDIYKSENISVPHAFTTRLGGVSVRAGYDTLNLGIKTDDEFMRKNYDIVRGELDIEHIVLCNQEHTTTVLSVTMAEDGVGLTRPLFPFGVDALITDVENLTLGIFYADCVPILLYDPVRRAIGAVHSGWRGTVDKIIVVAVTKMREAYDSDPKNIRAAIGPCIQMCHFETDGDVKNEFALSFKDFFPHMSRNSGDKTFIDMPAGVRRDLVGCGVLDGNINTINECTVCSNDRLFSHRCGDGGRMAAFITL